MIWVAAAGPAMNLLMAFFCSVAWKLLAPGIGDHGQPTGASRLSDYTAALVLMAQSGILINIVLAVFNMLPLPPLDGGRVMVGLLPPTLSMALAKVEPYGFIILIVLLMTHTLDRIIDPPTEFLLRLYLGAR
jgi:Zn-dependent protease